MEYTSFKKTPTSNELFLNEVDALVLAQRFPCSCNLAVNTLYAKVWKETALCQKAQRGQFHLAAWAASLIYAIWWRNRGPKCTEGVTGDTLKTYPDHRISSKSSIKLGNG